MMFHHLPILHHGHQAREQHLVDNLVLHMVQTVMMIEIIGEVVEVLVEQKENVDYVDKRGTREINVHEMQHSMICSKI